MIPGAALTRVIKYGTKFEELLRHKNITGGGTVYLSTEDNALITNSPGNDDKAYAYENIYVPPGGFVEISCEARQYDNWKGGRIAVDLHTTKAVVGGGNVDYIEVEDQEWRPYKMVVPSRPGYEYLSVTFGVWAVSVGKAGFRNIEIKVYGTSMNTLQSRAGMLRGVGSAWDVDDDVDRFVNTGISAVEAYSGYLIVRYRAFETWHRPVCFAQMDQYGGKNKYYCLVGGATHESCTVYIIDATTGAPVNPTSLSGTVFVNFMAVSTT
jgi:hypothetical protein